MDPYGNDGLILTGKSADYMGVEGKMRYEARIKAIPEGGTMKTDDVNLIIENANSVTLYFAAATNFVNYKDVSADQHQRVTNYFKAIENKNYNSILTSAIADHKKYFDRVSLQLPNTRQFFFTNTGTGEKNSNRTRSFYGCIELSVWQVPDDWFFKARYRTRQPAGNLE